MSFRPLPLLGAVFAVALTGCTVELQHDLSEDDANDIYVLLQTNGYEAKKLKEEGGNEPKYTISVAKADVAAAAQLLRENALPRPRFDGLGVFKKMKGMIPTQTEERAMFIEALGGEVSNSLNQIPGVLEARCIVMIPEVNDLTQPDKKPMPSASVFIKYRSPDGKIPYEEEKIKAFVATAVPELRTTAITVFSTAAPQVAALSPDDLSNEMVSVMGLTMRRGSADSFKVMVAFGALLTLAMAGLTVFAFTRKPSNGHRPPQRTKTNTPPAAEG